jgi:hypothetical protein
MSYNHDSVSVGNSREEVPDCRVRLFVDLFLGFRDWVAFGPTLLAIAVVEKEV